MFSFVIVLDFLKKPDLALKHATRKKKTLVTTHECNRSSVSKPDLPT